MKSKVALVGLPFDENSSFLRGSASGPRAIREALFSESSNLWTENGFDLSVPAWFADTGDVSAFDEIERPLLQLLEESRSPICLGGDHSVTYPILRAVSQKFDTISILHFDAHPDLYDDFGGNRYSHASPFARIMEEKLAIRLVQVGIRSMTGHQREQAQRFGVEVIEMKDWRDDLLLHLDAPIYVSVDMDALDPAFAPGVSHPEGGGLSTRQVVRIIQSISPGLVAADVVEYNPTKDISGITAAACAKIVKELAGKMLEELLTCGR